MGHPVALTVAVVDAVTGQPIGHAVVACADRERHAVDTRTGTWTGELLYFRDGSELFFVPNLALDLDVVAAGYAPAATVHRIGRGRRDRVVVALSPLPWAPDASAPAIEQRMWGEYGAWVDRSAELVADPSEDTVAAREVARRRTAQLAEDWLAYVDETGRDRGTAETVCRSTATHPERCAR